MALISTEFDHEYDPTNSLDYDLRKYRFLKSEWGILNDDMRQSNANVLRKLSQLLVFLGLNVLEDYDTSAAIDLLGKSQDELIFRSFGRNYKDVFGSDFTHDETLQVISLARRLLDTAGVRRNFRQYKVPLFTASNNFKIYGFLIGIDGSNPFGKFDPKKMVVALSRSKVFKDKEIRMLDVVGWSRKLMTLLPIGKPEGYMDLPVGLLEKLGSGQVDVLRVFIAQFYRQHPSLRMPGNNILVFLAYCATINWADSRVLSDWAASSVGSKFYKVLVEKYQESQTVQQLALRLAALLSYNQLLHSAPTPPSEPSSLADFNALINGSSLTNTREVFERMTFSFVRVLGTYRVEHQDVVQFLVTVLDADPTLLNSLDGFSDQFWSQRLNGFSHKEAFEVIKFPQSSTTICEGSKIDEDWVMDGYE